MSHLIVIALVMVADMLHTMVSVDATASTATLLVTSAAASALSPLAPSYDVATSSWSNGNSTAGSWLTIIVSAIIVIAVALIIVALCIILARPYAPLLPVATNMANKLGLSTTVNGMNGVTTTKINYVKIAPPLRLQRQAEAPPAARSSRYSQHNRTPTGTTLSLATIPEDGILPFAYPLSSSTKHSLQFMNNGNGNGIGGITRVTTTRVQVTTLRVEPISPSSLPHVAQSTAIGWWHDSPAPSASSPQSPIVSIDTLSSPSSPSSSSSSSSVTSITKCASSLSSASLTGLCRKKRHTPSNLLPVFNDDDILSPLPCHDDDDHTNDAAATIPCTSFSSPTNDNDHHMES
jgi:hypothetical protein